MKAHELLADPENWTQGMYHRFKEIAKEHPYQPGEDLPDNTSEQLTEIHEHPTDYCHCVMGALRICYPNPIVRSYILIKVEEVLGKNGTPYTAITSFNDSHTHEEVLNLLKQADV